MSLLRTFVGILISHIFSTIEYTHGSSLQLGSMCWGDPDCWIVNSHCVDWRCVCRETHIPNQNDTRCVIDIEQKCTGFLDVCYDPNAACRDPDSWVLGNCRCTKDFRLHPVDRVCLPALNSNCKTDGLVCIDGLCDDGICSCPQGLIPNLNLDRCSTGLGEICTQSTVCSDSNATCRQGGTCDCNTGFQEALLENGDKFCGKVLGAFCTNSTECAGPNTSCEAMRNGRGACTCLEGFVPAEARDKCLPVATHWLGLCTEDKQCTAMFGRYSLCENNHCSCSLGYHYERDDFGCVATHGTHPRAFKGIKSLIEALLPHLPDDVKIVAEQVLEDF